MGTSLELSQFARVGLGTWPTPLEPCPRLSEALGGPRILIKRDDVNGLGVGGNKLRKLEFLLGAALEAGADTVITFGGLQTNHGRQNAAACARRSAAPAPFPASPSGDIGAAETVVFLHTGGLPGLFGYAPELIDAVSR